MLGKVHIEKHVIGKNSTLSDRTQKSRFCIGRHSGTGLPICPAQLREGHGDVGEDGGGVGGEALLGRPLGLEQLGTAKGVRLGQKMQIGPCIPVGMQL